MKKSVVESNDAKSLRSRNSSLTFICTFTLERDFNAKVYFKEHDQMAVSEFAL